MSLEVPETILLAYLPQIIVQLQSANATMTLRDNLVARYDHGGAQLAFLLTSRQLLAAVDAIFQVSIVLKTYKANAGWISHSD